MVGNKLILNLMYTGLSEYEARAYVALLGASAVTAYEIAKSAGISTSKIYEVMARLLERGMVAQQEVGSKSKYVAQSPEDFLSLRRHIMEATFTELDKGLEEASSKIETSTIWNISNYDDLMEKTLSMVGGAQDSLLLSLWEQEAGELEPMLQRADRRGVKIATLHYGASALKIGTVYPHPIQHTVFREKGGRSLVVVADSKEALMGTVSGDIAAQGAHSRNHGFVSMADEYIRHDIYMMKVVNRFDPELKKLFGPEYQKLRNVFADEEVA